MDDPHKKPNADLELVLRIQNAIDMLPSPIFIKDGNYRYIACNRAYEAYIGLPSEKIIGSTVYDISPADLAPIYEAADHQLMADGGTQTYESNVRYADGSYHDVIFYKSVFYNERGEKDGISGVILDITDRKRLENELAHAAKHDFLTGILNLRTFYEIANQELARYKRTLECFSLLVLDLDHFKSINDTHGHQIGDEALKAFTLAIQSHLREQDIFARAGGDEFRLLLPGTNASGARHLAERIQAAINAVTIALPDGALHITSSIGVCQSRPGDKNIDDLVHRADVALYQAKEAGRNCVRLSAEAELQP